jgi:hypothetical protein
MRLQKKRFDNSDKGIVFEHYHQNTNIEKAN